MDSLIKAILVTAAFLSGYTAKATYLDSVEVSNFPLVQPVSQSGTWNINSILNPVSITGSVAVTGGLTDTQLRASAVPVSLASVPTHPVTQSGTWNVGLSTGVNAIGSITNTSFASTQSGSWTVGVNNFPSTQTVNGTVTSNIGTGNLAGITNTVVVKADTLANQTNAFKVDGSAVTQPISGAVSVSNFPATQPISAVSLPLPSGASTSALQSTGNSSVASIDGKTPALGQALAAGSVPVVLTAAQLTTLTPLSSVSITGTPNVNVTNSSIPVTGTFFQATQPVSIASSVAVTGPLTDTQLRASAVPISGTVTANTGLSQPLTDTQLRASSVPVSGTFFQATQPVSLASVPLATNAAKDRTTAASPYSNRLSDGTVFYDARSIRALTSSDVVTFANTTLAVTGPLTDTQLRASAVPVSLTSTTVSNFPATQAISAASLPLPSGAATSALQSTQDTSINSLLKPASTLSAVTTVGTVNAVTAITNALPTGANKIGTVDIATAPATAKGTQGANGVPTQDLKDAGRVMKVYSASFTAATTEALVTLTPISDGTAGGTATSFTVTSGKRLRLQSICVTTRNAGAGGQGVVVNLRMTATGAITATSPLVGTVSSGTALAVANITAQGCAVISDGQEFSGTMQFGLTQVGTATANNTVVLTGYEY